MAAVAELNQWCQALDDFPYRHEQDPARFQQIVSMPDGVRMRWFSQVQFFVEVLEPVFNGAEAETVPPNSVAGVCQK